MPEKLSDFHSKRGTCIRFIGQSFYLIQCVQHLETPKQISQHKASLCDALESEYIRLDLFKTNPRNPFVYSVLTGNLSQGGLIDSRPHGKLGSEKVSCCSQSGRVALLHTRPSELKLFYTFILSPSILTIPHFLSRLISTSMKCYQCPYSSRTQT